jgi:UDP:flavonoid glycosyltransferase YjiC (YdhE family)
VRLFITHGGLQSIQEAIHRGVPLVGIPIYADQYYNLARIVSFGIGIRLDYEKHHNGICDVGIEWNTEQSEVRNFWMY